MVAISRMLPVEQIDKLRRPVHQIDNIIREGGCRGFGLDRLKIMAETDIGI